MIACSSHAFSPLHTGGKFTKRRAMQKRLFLLSPDFGYPLLLMNTCICIWIYAYKLIYAYKKKAIYKETLVFCFHMVGTPMHELRHWGWAGCRAEDWQQGSRSSVTLTPHAGYRGVGAPEVIRWLCWGWRGKRTGGRPWCSPGTIWPQGLRQSWPFGSCVHRHGGPYSPSLPEGTSIIFILLERCQCLSQAATITRRTQSTGYQPTCSKMQIDKVSSTNTQWLKISHFQHSEAVCKFFTDRKDSTL